MMANVRLRAVSCPVDVIEISVGESGLPKIELQHDGVFAPIGGLMIPATNADLFESESLIEADRGQVAGPDFEECLADTGSRRPFQHMFEQAAP